MFMRPCATSRVKRTTFYRKSELQMFLLISGGQLVDQNSTQVWRLHTKLYKGAWYISANNSETVGHKDLGRGQIVYIVVFYNISFSWFLPLDGFQFIFVLRDGENDLYTKHGSEFANWPLKRGRWMSRGEKAAQQIFDFLYWPSECFRHGLSIKVERKDVSKHRESCKAWTGWHVSELVEHHQVMKKEQQKQQQKNISETELVNHAKHWRRHGEANVRSYITQRWAICFGHGCCAVITHPD